MPFWAWNVAMSMKDSDAPLHEHCFPMRVKHHRYGTVTARGPCACGMDYLEWLVNRSFARYYS